MTLSHCLQSSAAALSARAAGLLLLGLFASAAAGAQQTPSPGHPTLTWWVVGSGGVLGSTTSASDTLSATLGQTATGSTISPVNTAEDLALGFWIPALSGTTDDAPAQPGISATALFALASSPNPFQGRTTISYTLPSSGEIRLRVFDVTGREVRRLLDEPQTAGPHAAVWDALDDNGGTLPSAVYFYALELRADDAPPLTARGTLSLLR